MKAGVIGVVDGSFRKVGSTTETVTRDGQTLGRALEIDRVFSLPSGSMAFSGRAAAERIHNGREATIRDGQISVTERNGVVTDMTEFVGVTGEFVVVESGDGAFAFDLIANETDTAIERATLDLDAFYSAHGEATPWKAGFYANGPGGMNGIFHGQDLRENHDIEAILENSRLNQVGLRYLFGDDEVKMTAARSGYVEVYQPSEYDSADYLDYVREQIVPHLE
ncbi:MAG: hypothetical protein ACOCQY_01110 [Halorhabdus sp.]